MLVASKSKASSGKHYSSGAVNRQYWSDKNLFSGPVSRVDWSCLAKAIDKSSLPNRIYAIKQATHRLPSGVEMVRRKARESSTCPSCHEPFETQQHILTCPARSSTWQQSLKKLRFWLISHTSFSATTQIILRLQHWHDFTPYPDLPTTTPRAFAQAILAQDLLGWDAFLYGFLAPEWQYAHQLYLNQLRSLANPKTLIASLIQKMWDVSWDQWQVRNASLHHRDTGIRQKQLHSRILEIKQTRLSIPTQDRALLRTPVGSLLKSPLDYQETWCRRAEAALYRISRHRARARDALVAQRAFMSAYFRQ